jgi:hypothetical protein
MSDYFEGKMQATPSDADVWQSAWIIAEQYGAEGVSFAAQMAQSFEIGGKLDAQKVWLSIMQKVETLTSEGVRPH